MKISFDPKHDIIRIKFQEGKYATSKEVDEGIVIDMTKDSKIMAIEILDVSSKIPKRNMKDFAMSISG